MVFHFIYHVHCTHLMNYSCFSCINLHPDFFFKFTLNYFPLFQFPLLPSTVLLPPLSSEVLPEFHSEIHSEFHSDSQNIAEALKFTCDVVFFLGSEQTSALWAQIEALLLCVFHNPWHQHSFNLTNIALMQKFKQVY